MFKTISRYIWVIANIPLAHSAVFVKLFDRLAGHNRPLIIPNIFGTDDHY